jgi:hypothetical protein
MVAPNPGSLPTLVDSASSVSGSESSMGSMSRNTQQMYDPSSNSSAFMFD